MEKELNKLGYGEFVCIQDNKLYKNDKYNVFIYDKNEYYLKIKKSLFEEIPYMKNEFLKPHLTEKFQSDIILNDIKELSKFDHTLISGNIKNYEMFYIDAITMYKNENESILDLLHPDSTLYLINDKHIIVSEI